MTTTQTCPVSVIANILGKKWNLEIIYYLQDSQRFCGLQELVTGVNSATLSTRLKLLENSGVINRQKIPDIHPHVDYSLTQKGRALLPIINQMITWTQDWHTENNLT